MKKTSIITFLLALMPIFCLLYAQGPIGHLPNVNRQAIEQRYYNEEINKSDYHEQTKKLSDIPQKISEREKALETEQRKEIGEYSFIILFLIILCVFLGIKAIRSGPREINEGFGYVRRVGSVWEMRFWTFVFIASSGSLMYLSIQGASEESMLEKNLAENFISDTKIAELHGEQKKIKEYLSNCEQSARKAIKPLVDSIYQAEVEKVHAMRSAEAERLREYAKRNNVSKKLRIIASSWQKEADTPEHGSLDGNLSSAGGGVGVLGVGGGIGAGMSKSKGKIKGEYVGRVYGEEYYFFHFILSDNSYHVIDAKKNPMWRMAKDRLIVNYERKYSDYNRYTEVITPIWTESSF